jgi:CheY-like chemotaxis protein
MAFKRALVVDDSKLARVALKNMLEAHELEVEFAETGEQALDFLDHESVDVVFMDHHMPGMDGLQAVDAIKKNPRTATIPVMMYTTRAGEVYLSQARALGAVGVLPKQVQPGVLFEMLEELGLVQERRAPAEQQQAGAEQAYEVDRRVNDQVTGISLQTIVKRILEDQHLSLRADILRGNRNFARQVAKEILAEQSEESEEAEEEQVERTYSQRTVTLLVLLLLVAALVLGGLYLNTADERDAALTRAESLDRTLDERLQAAETVTSGMLVDMNQERNETEATHLTGLAWSLTEAASHDFDQPAFDSVRLAQLQTLLEHLRELGYRGVVRLTSHLGEFCLAADRLGELAPASPETPIETCGTIGHPLDGSSFLAERQTEGFAEFMAARPENAQGVRIELVANDRFASTRRYPFPEPSTEAGGVSAEIWNETATRNNRVEYEFLPEVGE